MAVTGVDGGSADDHAAVGGHRREHRSTRTTIARTLVLGVVGFVLGMGVQQTLWWIEASMVDDTQMWAGLGAALTAMSVGVPIGLALTLAAFGLARVPEWPVAATVALGFAYAGGRVAAPLLASSPTDDPVVWPWCGAIAFGVAAYGFQRARGRAALVLVPVGLVLVAVLAVLGDVGSEKREDQWRAVRTEEITATGLPVLTTEIDGYVPVSAGARAPFPDSAAGPEITVTFVAGTTDEPMSFDQQVWLKTFRTVPWFAPPTNCPATNYHVDLGPDPCTEVAPGIWWSDRDDAAIRVDGDLLVVVDGSFADLPKEVLVEAAARAHPSDVETIAAYRS